MILGLWSGSACRVIESSTTRAIPNSIFAHCFKFIDINAQCLKIYNQSFGSVIIKVCPTNRCKSFVLFGARCRLLSGQTMFSSTARQLTLNVADIHGSSLQGSTESRRLSFLLKCMFICDAFTPLIV